jgi:hypothetical protein
MLNFEQHISIEEWHMNIAWMNLCILYLSHHVLCSVWSEQICAESPFATDDEATTCVSVCGV